MLLRLDCPLLVLCRKIIKAAKIHTNYMVGYLTEYHYLSREFNPGHVNDENFPHYLSQIKTKTVEHNQNNGLDFHEVRKLWLRALHHRLLFTVYPSFIEVILRSEVFNFYIYITQTIASHLRRTQILELG